MEAGMEMEEGMEVLGSWQGHFIALREVQWGCSTPTPSLLMVPEATRAPAPHQASSDCPQTPSAYKGASSILPLPLLLRAHPCRSYFWHKLLVLWPSQALQAPLKGSVCPGPGWESWK